MTDAPGVDEDWPVEQWPVHEIAADARFRVVREMPPLPASLDAEVNRLWAQAQRRLDGELFNGQVFSADVLTPHLVCGHWTEFRRIVAQMQRPDLHPQLGVRPLAVGGLIYGPDGVVFGRRPSRSVYQSGEWQLAPAGSVDAGSARPQGVVDVLHQLLAELQEELGLPPEAVAEPRLLCIVEHAGSHVLDLGILVRGRWPAARILAAHAGDGNGEYEKLEIVPPAALPGFLRCTGRMLNRQAPVFLVRSGLLMPGRSFRLDSLGRLRFPGRLHSLAADGNL